MSVHDDSSYFDDYSDIERDAINKGQGKMNQLGGVFINGRPLPTHIRMKIIEMSKQGIRPCVISRQLKVSHGCVSKILQRFHETGSVKPGAIGGGNKTRQNKTSIEACIDKYCKENPSILSYDIRNKLIEDKICDYNNVPSISSISRLTSRNKKTYASLSSSLSAGDDDNDDNNENYYDEDNKARKRCRTSFNTEQIATLETIFKQTHYPDVSLREEICKRTRLNEAKIQVWFSNRRAKWRKNAIHHTTSSFAAAAAAVAAVASSNKPIYTNNNEIQNGHFSSLDETQYSPNTTTATVNPTNTNTNNTDLFNQSNAIFNTLIDCDSQQFTSNLPILKTNYTPYTTTTSPTTTTSTTAPQNTFMLPVQQPTAPTTNTMMYNTANLLYNENYYLNYNRSLSSQQFNDTRNYDYLQQTPFNQYNYTNTPYNHHNHHYTNSQNTSLHLSNQYQTNAPLKSSSPLLLCYN